MILQTGALLRQVLDAAARRGASPCFRPCVATMFALLLRFNEASASARADMDLSLVHGAVWGRLVFLDADHGVIAFTALEREGSRVEWIDWGFGRTKAEQVNGGTIRSLHRNRVRPQHCPVALLVELGVWALRMGADGKDAVFLDWTKPLGRRRLTNKVFNAELRLFLVGCVDQGVVLTAELAQLYSSHGLRAGACTELFLLRIPVETIKMLGRWRSNAYQRYRRVARELFGRLARSIIDAPVVHILDRVV